MRLGPYVRKERDKRLYNKLFTSIGQISKLRRLLLLTFCSKLSVEKYTEYSQKGKYIAQRTVVCFSDMNHFERLVGRHNEVSEGIKLITKKKYLPFGLENKLFIGIHVRLGDFPSVAGNNVYYRIPLQWYIACLREIRRSIKMDLEAIIFSDASDLELESLLNEPFVNRSPFKESITDMLALSQSLVIITSRSTFSLWGSFLGQVPSIWFPPKSDICVNAVFTIEGAPVHEIEWNMGEQLPAPFIIVVLDRVKEIFAYHRPYDCESI